MLEIDGPPAAEVWRAPKKGDFRQRAHCNPLSDSFIQYPQTPDFVDLSTLYPGYFSEGSGDGNDSNRGDGSAILRCSPPPPKLYLNTIDYPCDFVSVKDENVNGSLAGAQQIEIVDLGCGYGGLSLALAKEFPSTLILALEIREKVTEYLGRKILALREEESRKGNSKGYQNVAVLRSNAMKNLLNFCRSGTLTKICICFPDPHFKRANWRRRIVTVPLLTMYAYLMKPKGRIYIISDVEDTYNWMVACLDRHPLFERVSDQEAEKDFTYKAMQHVTEEGIKAIRLGKELHAALYERIIVESH